MNAGSNDDEGDNDGSGALNLGAVGGKAVVAGELFAGNDEYAGDRVN